MVTPQAFDIFLEEDNQKYTSIYGVYIYYKCLIFPHGAFFSFTLPGVEDLRYKQTFHFLVILILL